MPSIHYSTRERRGIASAAQCSPRTVARYLEGRVVRPAIRAAIERAAKRLKIALPAVVASP